MCPLSELQTTWYKQLLLREKEVLSELTYTEDGTASAPPEEKASTGQWQRLRMLLVQLRKVANHPFLFDEADTVTNDGEVVTDGESMFLHSFFLVTFFVFSPQV
jgi:SWI/SNF-related matrix-associated actin-dependent regulator of chromatin subfamily A member 5